MSARVIPPLAAISPGATDDDALFVVTDAQLTSSTVPEAPPAAYNAGTTYAAAVQVSVSATGNAFDVYESLAAGNIGHTPASSPTFWKSLGRTYGVYAAGTYALDDRVIDTTTHLQYRSLVSINNAAPSDPTKWELEGPTNRWKALDILRNTKATGPSPMTYVITPGKRIDAVGLAGLLADSFTIAIKVGGVTKWTYTEQLTTRNTLTWSDYFFGSFTYRDVSAVFDIPKYSGAEIHITLTRSGGDVEVGGIWINEAVYLGELETAPGVDRRSFSTFERDIGGDAVLIRRATKPANTWTVYLEKARLPKVKPLPAELDAVPAMWVGLEEVTDEYFDLVVLVAVYTRFTITPDHPDVRLDIELEEA